MIAERLGVSAFEALPPTRRPNEENDLSRDFLQRLARLTEYENSVPELRKRLLNARKSRLATKKGQTLTDPTIQLSDVSVALREILHEQEIQPIVEPQVPIFSTGAVELSYKDSPALVLKLKMPKDTPMQAFDTSTSSYVTSPVLAAPRTSDRNSSNLKRSSKSTAAVQIGKWTNMLGSSADDLSGELSDLKYGSDTSDEIPILSKRRLASTRSNRSCITSIYKTPIHKDLRSSSTKDKTSRLTGGLAPGRSLRNMNRKLDESSRKRVEHNRPNFLKDDLANITDFDSITYPVEIPVPHEPHTFRIVENAEGLKALAVKAKAECNRAERSSSLSPIPHAVPSGLLNPTRIQLDQLQQQFADSMFFIQGTTHYSRFRPLNEMEIARVEKLSDTFLADYKNAQARFESGLRKIGVLPKEEEDDHIPASSLEVFGQIPRLENSTSSVQLQPSGISGSPSLPTKQEGVSELKAAIIIDLQDGYESSNTE